MNNTNQENKIQEESIQVVLVDVCYEDSLKPISYKTPQCLVKLSNVPIINYTIELFLQYNFKDITIITISENYKKILKHLNELKNNNKLFKDLNTSFVVCNQFFSICDALRELDSKSIVRDDFILSSTCLVSKVDLIKITNFHREKKSKDKNILLTMNFKKENKSLHLKENNANKNYIIINSKSKELVCYENKQTLKNTKALNLSNSNQILKETNNEETTFVMESGLVDCFVDVCSIEVLSLVSENFDYQELRNDFIKGVLTSDIINKTIYVNVVDNKEYISNVDSIDKLYQIGMDILERQLFPFVPETNMDLNKKRYSSYKNLIYKKCSNLAKSCVLESHVIIGNNTFIGEGSVVKKCIIGDNCVIGKNCILTECVLFESVKLGDFCQIRSSVLGNNCSIGDECEIKNSTFSDEVVLKSLSVVLSEKTTLITNKMIPYYKDQIKETTKLEDINENNANVVIFETEDNDPTNITTSTTEEELELTESEDSSELEEENFAEEVVSTIERAQMEKHSTETIALELNTLRMSFNSTFTEIIKILITFLLKQALDESRSKNKTTVSLLQKMIKTWSPLINRFVLNEDDQLYLIQVVQEFTARSESLCFFVTIVQSLYNCDLVEEETILNWYQMISSRKDQQSLNFQMNISPFINWLKEAEEESSNNSDE